jgi:hypothetical protein
MNSLYDKLHLADFLCSIERMVGGLLHLPKSEVYIESTEKEKNENVLFSAASTVPWI